MLYLLLESVQPELFLYLAISFLILQYQFQLQDDWRQVLMVQPYVFLFMDIMHIHNREVV
jgi:hypothetical protein